MEVATESVTHLSDAGILHPNHSLQLAPTGFPHILYNILETERQSVITWTSSGKAFGIQDMAAFTNQVLPKHFKHAKFPSFQRQLNLYGFRKIVRGREAGGYMHMNFRRGRLDLLKYVRRGKCPPCPREYERKIYGCGGRAEESSDSDPELIAQPRGAATAVSFNPNPMLKSSVISTSDSSVNASLCTDSHNFSETVLLNDAANQLRRLSVSRGQYNPPMVVPAISSNINRFDCHVDDSTTSPWSFINPNTSMGYHASRPQNPAGNNMVPLKHEVVEDGSCVSNINDRRKSSLNGMKKLFSKSRISPKLPRNDSVGATTNLNLPIVTPIQPLSDYQNMTSMGFSQLNNNSYMNSNGGVPLSPLQTIGHKRSSFCAMVVSLEQKMQEKGSHSDLSDPLNTLPALFTSPNFTTQMKEFANELQTSVSGFDTKPIDTERGSPTAGLELLHTTAVRRRSSLTELCAAANRRGSLTDLYRGIISDHGRVDDKSNGRKHRRISKDDVDRYQNSDVHTSSDGGTIGATLRPSIQTAFSILRSNQNNGSDDSNIGDWMDGYYLDDAIRDLDKVEAAESTSNIKSEPDISQSKLRASVYVLLSVLSTADGEMAASTDINASQNSSQINVFPPQFNPQTGSINLQNHNNESIFNRSEGFSCEAGDKW